MRDAPCPFQDHAPGSVHSCLVGDSKLEKVEGRPCRMMGCERVFRPRRRNQFFCSAECRKGHFSLARTLGLRLIEAARQNERWAKEAVRHLDGGKETAI
jgi:hypothetical protein